MREGPDRLHLWNMGLEVAFDAHLKGHPAGRATHACPVEPHFDRSVRGDINELDVSAVGLHRWSDKADHLCHSVADGAGIGDGAVAHRKSVGRSGAGVNMQARAKP